MNDLATFNAAIQAAVVNTGYIAVAPGNVVVFDATNEEDATFVQEFAFGEAPEWLTTGLNEAILGGLPVIDMRSMPDANRYAILDTVQIIGMPAPTDTGNVAFLANFVMNAGGQAHNVPSAD